MPAVNPGSSKPMPSDWRWAWNAFVGLQNIAKKAGIDVSGWQLIYPSAAQRIVDPRWKIAYTIPVAIDKGTAFQTSTAYLGSTGRIAAETLGNMAKDYARLAKSHQELVSKPKPVRIDPMYSDDRVRQALDTWNREMKKIRSTQDARKFKENYPKLNALMDRKAGILNMSLREYLTRHPLSTLFPTPPRSEEELHQRQEQYKRYVESMEKTRKDQAEDHARLKDTVHPWEGSTTTDWYA